MTPIQRPLSPQPARARRELRSFLESKAWPGDVDAVVLAVHEALINSVDHAGGINSALAKIQGRAVVVEVSDQGPGFEPKPPVTPPDPLAERGRGLWLIDQLAASWE